MVVPATSLRLPRLIDTLQSVGGQKALLEGSTRVQVVIVSPDQDHGPLEEWIASASTGLELTFMRDEGVGLYAALAGAFGAHSGSFNTYIGAGDTLEPQTFSVVREILGPLKSEPAWMTGMIATRRADGTIVRTTLPPGFTAVGFSTGRYGRVAPSIQQESSWWNERMHETINLHELARWRLAGDYYLWRTFSLECPPLIVEAVIGSFRWHHDNMSGDWVGYLQEIEDMCGPLSRTDRIAGIPMRMRWAMPNRWKVRHGNGRVLRWNWPDGPWISSEST